MGWHDEDRSMVETIFEAFDRKDLTEFLQLLRKHPHLHYMKEGGIIGSTLPLRMVDSIS